MIKTAVFWRYNPQMKNGGYETKRTIEAKTMPGIKKEIRRIENGCVYGGMSFIRFEEDKQ